MDHGVSNLTVAWEQGEDQPVHPRSLINTFTNPFLESMLFKFAMCKL